MTSLSRAILFRVGGLGDLLVALPAVSLVRRSHPDLRLTLVGRPEYGSLFELAGVVDDIVAFDDARMTSFFGGDSPFDSGMHGKKKSEERGDETALGSRVAREGVIGPPREFSLALGWLNRRGDWPDDDWWVRRGITRTFFVSYGKGQGEPMNRIFFDRTRDYLRTSVIAPLIASPDGSGKAAEKASRETMKPNVNEGLPIVSTAGSPGSFDECARLTLGREPVERALAGLGLRVLGAEERRLVVHPGSGGRAKRWPLRSFVEVIGHAAARRLEGVLVTGEAEADVEAELRGWALPIGWTRFSRLTPETLAGLLAGSTHYIGNDSGPTHLAAACGVSVLAIFRDENLPAWRPFGRTRVLSAPAVERIPPEAVITALDDFLRP
jgi:hypothetical protein